MKETYTKLMLQQHTSPDGDVVFFEKLDKAGKKPTPVWRMAVAAACILLMIPVTVYAVNNVFHRSKAKELRYSRPVNLSSGADWAFRYQDDVSMVGYELEYEGLTRFSIKDFPKDVRKAEKVAVNYEAWNTAAEELNIGILNNPILDAEETTQILLLTPYDKHSGRTHCRMVYSGVDEQPYSAYLSAMYNLNDVDIKLEAHFAIEHPTAIEALYEHIHKYGIRTDTRGRPNFTHEEYTTANGIPVTITTFTRKIGGRLKKEYSAHFAVNDISYSIELYSNYNSITHGEYEDYVKTCWDSLITILDGFTVE